MMVDNSANFNMPAYLTDVLRRNLSLKKRDHIARLVRLPEPYLNKLQPDRPAPISKILMEYNERVAEELDLYTQCLKREVLKIANTVDGRVKNSEIKSAMLRVLDEFITPDLYENRFDIFWNQLKETFPDMASILISTNIDQIFIAPLLRCMPPMLAEESG